MAGTLGKYSFGTGDRFGFEAEAQLKALLMIHDQGVPVTPVWNKSHREHASVNSRPEDVRKEVERAVEKLWFRGSYFVDADHINLRIIDPYIPVSDFFTIDVADFIGKPAEEGEKKAFIEYVENYSRILQIPGIQKEISIEEEQLNQMINAFLLPAKEASKVYQHIKARKGGVFYVEISMDEVERPQSPVELFFALAAIAFYNIPVMTIAPKFSGKFNKGVDYEGDLEKFEKEFEKDLLVINYAVQEFGLPSELKLSIHSGSDKFSIYPIMKTLIMKHDVGLHVKTAGTTWLEEICTLGECGKDGFEFLLEVYKASLDRFDELTSPYPNVLDIDTSNLPEVKTLREQGREMIGKALRHNKLEKRYNPDFRQLMHCAYKIAAERSEVFHGLLQKYRPQIVERVTANIYENHLVPLFLDSRLKGDYFAFNSRES